MRSLIWWYIKSYFKLVDYVVHYGICIVLTIVIQIRELCLQVDVIIFFFICELGTFFADVL